MLNPVRPPKRPLIKHRPKPAETSQSCQFLLVFAQDKQPALPITNNSAKKCTKPTKPQQNQRKSPQKGGGVYSTQAGQSGPPSGRCLAGCGHSAVRSQKQKRTAPSQSGQNARNGRWPLACVLLLWRERLSNLPGLMSHVCLSLSTPGRGRLRLPASNEWPMMMSAEHESAAPLTGEWLVRRALARCPRSAKCTMPGDRASLYAVMGTLRWR